MPSHWFFYRKASPIVRSIGNINAVLNVSAFRFEANAVPADTATAACAVQLRAISRLSRRTARCFSAAGAPRASSGRAAPCPGIEPTASVENTLELVTLSETLQPGAGGARPGGSRGACTGRALFARCARIALITTGSSILAMMRSVPLQCAQV